MSAYWVWTCVLTTAMTHRGLTLVAVNRGIPWILMDTVALVCTILLWLIMMLIYYSF